MAPQIQKGCRQDTVSAAGALRHITDPLGFWKWHNYSTGGRGRFVHFVCFTVETVFKRKAKLTKKKR